MHISGISLEALNGQHRLHHKRNLSVFALLGWIGNLDGSHITDLVLSSPTLQLKMTAHYEEIDLSFTGEGAPHSHTVILSRAIATDMALYFLRNNGLPPT